MSGLHLRGVVVSVETFAGVSKKTGKPFCVHTAYVVNGGGKPEVLKVPSEVGKEHPYKSGAKVDMPVRVGIFNGEYALYPEQY